MPHCENCGEEYEFCGQCGAPLDTETPPTAEPCAPEYAAEPYPEQPPEAEETPTPPARGHRGGFAAAGLILGALALAVCSLSPLALLLSLPFSLIGLTFSAIARGRRERGAALGMVLNIAALVASTLLFMRCAFVLTDEVQGLGWEMRYLLDTQFGYAPGATPAFPIDPGTPL